MFPLKNTCLSWITDPWFSPQTANKSSSWWLTEEGLDVSQLLCISGGEKEHIILPH